MEEKAVISLKSSLKLLVSHRYKTTAIPNSKSDLRQNLSRTRKTFIALIAITALIALPNLLQPSPIRQHLVTLALLQPNLRPTPPLPLPTPPNAMILQPPVHNLSTNPVRRSHTVLLPLEVHPTLRPTRNPAPTHEIPLILHDPRLVRLSPHDAADDQRAAHKQHHANHKVQQPIALAPREERPVVLPSFFAINVAADLSRLGFRGISSRGGSSIVPVGGADARVQENRPGSRLEQRSQRVLPSSGRSGLLSRWRRVLVTEDRDEAVRTLGRCGRTRHAAVRGNNRAAGQSLCSGVLVEVGLFEADCRRRSAAAPQRSVERFPGDGGGGSQGVLPHGCCCCCWWWGRRGARLCVWRKNGRSVFSFSSREKKANG
jgi:hypothetical protein